MASCIWGVDHFIEECKKNVILKHHLKLNRYILQSVVRTVTEDMMAEGKEAYIPIGSSSAALLTCQTFPNLSAIIITLNNKISQILHSFPNII